MAVIRVEKTHDYTVMSNYHFREKELSLKAKGLMSLMLSLPDDWDYTLEGLSKINKDGIDSIRAALKELETFGYVKRKRVRDSKGVLGGTEYIIIEKPILENPTLENPTLEKPILENPTLEKPTLENPTQLNTKELNTKELNKKEVNTKKIKHKYGEYSHVLLTDDERDKLITGYGEIESLEAIRYLDEYIEMKGYKAKSHYLCIKKWVFDAIKEKKTKASKQNSYMDAIANRVDVVDNWV